MISAAAPVSMQLGLLAIILTAVIAVPLGMIAAHSPETLNLILVDFKGGATFLDLDRSPHVAAVITNLAGEAHLVARMQDALAGEINRRQEVLRAAGNLASTLEYERMRCAGAPLPALPALFLIIDEFSELLSRHPDFADTFTAIGRLGRSLGMHLLRFVMMADVLPADEVLAFLASLRTALATFVATLEQASTGPDVIASPAARLAVEHGLAVHRASLAWTGQAISALSGRTVAS